MKRVSDKKSFYCHYLKKKENLSVTLIKVNYININIINRTMIKLIFLEQNQII